MSAVTISSIGLVLDIIGAILLWKYGLPEAINRGGEQFLTLEQSDENEAAKARRYDWYSKVALTLLIMGFALQLAGNYLS